ncbi:MAG: helix-turn-helix transcriptional regulator [Ruminococcaceae bacterium]|nr:helix-turn-helix transcriptional regulator [Oscillospiraceae bacterium]
MDKYTFGNKLYKLRTESNLTQKELANILGVSDKAVSKWETGEAMPRVKTLKNIADCFSVTYEDLLSQTEELKTNETEKYEAYESFYQKRVTKLKKDINDHLLVVLFAATLNLIIKAVIFLQAELAGTSVSGSYLFFSDFIPLVVTFLFFAVLKKFLKSGVRLVYKQYDYLWYLLISSIGSQIFSTLVNLNASRVYILLCDFVVYILMCILSLYQWLKIKKGKDVAFPKRDIFLYSGILLLSFLVMYLTNTVSFAVMVNVVKILFVNFLSVFIIYEMMEYQSLLEIKKETINERIVNKTKRNVKNVITICLVVVLILGIFALFVPGFIFKVAMKRIPSAYQETLFYSELDISFDDETLVDYEVDGIKFSLPESYVFSEKIEHEYYTMLKFSKPGCDDFLFGVTKRKETTTEPLDITGELFSGEDGARFREMIEDTFGYYPKTNQEWNRLIYTINPDDVNIFDINECITYIVLLMDKRMATMDGHYDYEYFDNGIFQAEISKLKQRKLNKDGEIEYIEGEYDRYNVYIWFYSDKHEDGYYQIHYKPESGDTADLELLHKVLNTIEKAE